MSSEFGKFLKETRKRYGYKTQKQLADISGISQTTLSRIEAGLQRPLPETLRVLAEYLRPYTYGELMERAGYFEGMPAEDMNFIKEVFDESEQVDLDFQINKLLNNLSVGGSFTDDTSVFLKKELESLFESEGWTDIEFTPSEIRQLVRELDTNFEYKKVIMDALIRTQNLAKTKDNVETIAAHHEGEDWTEEELEEIERFKEFVRSKRKHQE